ncbi:conserved hypothetical protein [Candida tropicalis MYA-3404]|uniref:Haloacid dehalogenase-like hydrolase n=1 Tax=Candida tropicalis (strain ATCC MYA-3404 / T1) TaxID=294747 RepID=C5M5J3_CANTT|nr:conserved hypothetical protein [Candida tropicalis MYA-3404]EER34263.1 conserved hypothetical protein [Candida tropicalis MYA-3404]KAG4408128.1 hypothetical protein JTP64_001434 [Candida tropicalis]
MLLRCSNICRMQFVRMVSSKSQLISRPFDIANTKMIRETMERFPRPNFISFDLFGTLYDPIKPVPEQYYEIASKEFGIHKSAESIEKEFPIVYNEMLEMYPNYGKGNPKFENCDQWWGELIIRLFKLDRHDDQAWALSHRLIHHFTSDEAYKVYDDVMPTLKGLQERGIKLVAASNSDLKALTILDSLKIKSYFHCSEHFHCSGVFLSYDSGHSKPTKEFFDRIALTEYKAQVNAHYKGTRAPGQFLANNWHVGDSYSQDFVGAVRAGWNGVLLDRNCSSEFFQDVKKPQNEGCFLSETPQTDDNHNKKDMVILANNRVVITKLTQLLDIFDI